MSQFFCTISSAQPNIEEWSFLPMWINSSRKLVWKSANATRSRFLRLAQIKTMCISSFNQYRSTARKELCRSSKASRPGKSSALVQRSGSNSGADSSGRLDISSAQLDSMVMKQASSSTFKIKVRNTFNCTRNNSSYSDTSQLAAA